MARQQRHLAGDMLFQPWPNLEILPQTQAQSAQPTWTHRDRLRSQGSEGGISYISGQGDIGLFRDYEESSEGRAPPRSKTSELQVLDPDFVDVELEEELNFSEDSDVDNLNCWGVKVARLQARLAQWGTKHKTRLKEAVCLTFVFLYGIYFGYAMYFDYRRNVALAMLTFLVWLGFMFSMVKDIVGSRVSTKYREYSHRFTRVRKYASWAVVGLVLVGLVIFIALDVRTQPIRLLSGCGLFLFLLLAWLCSKDRSKLDVRLMVGGLCLQLVFGLLILRWERGLQAFDWFGRQFTTFLGYADFGSEFVFGEKFLDHEFVFQVMPGVVFFSACVVLLYYLRALQVCIEKLGFVMQGIMGIGPVEAFIAAANVFLGPSVSVLTIARFMPEMTLSELHCVLTTGFATVTGGLLGAYTSFGVPPSHLISASVMSAPAALVTAKLLYPETEQSKITDVEDITFPEPEEKSAMEAYSSGASAAVNIVGNIVVNLVAFVAMLTALNAGLDWAGQRVGLYDLSLQLVFSYLFAPLVFFMGVASTDCLEVGRLIGSKIFLSDIIAYSELGKLIKNREAGLDPTIQPRSEVIATYALCGFGNFSDMGICLGAIGAIVPSRRGDLAQVALRAMVAGNLACFITASLAGFLYNGE